MPMKPAPSGIFLQSMCRVLPGLLAVGVQHSFRHVDEAYAQRCVAAPLESP